MPLTPQSPPHHILLSFRLSPSLPPSPPQPVLPCPLPLGPRVRWAAQGLTVIGLDIIYCPLGNVAFQHLIKIISSHSNGRYGLKGTHCDHLDTRGGSCSPSLALSLCFPLFSPPVSVVLCLWGERLKHKLIYCILHVCVKLPDGFFFSRSPLCFFCLFV